MGGGSTGRRWLKNHVWRSEPERPEKTRGPQVHVAVAQKDGAHVLLVACGAQGETGEVVGRFSLAKGRRRTKPWGPKYRRVRQMVVAQKMAPKEKNRSLREKKTEMAVVQK